jgi:hypothetical protein
MCKTRCCCNVIIIIIASDIDVVVVGYIKPFYFVRTMDAVGSASVCFFVIVVGTCIVVNGRLGSTIATIVIIYIFIIIIIIIIIISGSDRKDMERGLRKF